jgi:hypothetical protein
MQSSDKLAGQLESHESLDVDELSMQCELDDQLDRLQRVRQTFEFDAAHIALAPLTREPLDHSIDSD